MPKKLRATKITDRLPRIPENPDYCFTYIQGTNGLLEKWHCPYFEGRVNRAPIMKRWGRCNFLGITETFFTHPLSLLWDEVKHTACPQVGAQPLAEPTTQT